MMNARFMKTYYCDYAIPLESPVINRNFLKIPAMLLQIPVMKTYYCDYMLHKNLRACES